MNLSVILQNSQLKLGLIDESLQLQHVMVLKTDRQATAWDYASRIHSAWLMQKQPLCVVDQIALASVVPECTQRVYGALKMLFEEEPLLVRPGIRTGLNIRLNNPAELGADLTCEAVGAKQRYALPCLIITMNNAMTFSVLDEKGDYRGGVLLPGSETAMHALVSTSDLLCDVEQHAPGKVIGTSTQSCLSSGYYYGSAALIDGMIERLEEEFGKPFASYVVTGAYDQDICACCRHELQEDRALDMVGLALISQLNHHEEEL